MDNNDIPYLDFARLVEFAMALPGANAITERVFSEVTNVWRTESSQLKIDTLKSILLVKLNLDYTCIELHNLLKDNKEMLNKISSSEKYDFKKNETENKNDEPVDLNMSIDEDLLI